MKDMWIAVTKRGTLPSFLFDAIVSGASYLLVKQLFEHGFLVRNWAVSIPDLTVSLVFGILFSGLTNLFAYLGKRT
jgi:hypothetical protein